MAERLKDFYELVYEVVACIPNGRITTYGAIAEYLGQKGSARLVGWALNAVHQHRTDVPAHRVVNRNGLLTGKHHFSNPDQMQQLLENEKIKVVDNQIKDFQKHFWNPVIELRKH